jgi:hypothetical protein
MSEYKLTPLATLPSFAVQETRENRRKVLEAVRKRRKIIYTNFYKKMRLHANNDLATIAKV